MEENKTLRVLHFVPNLNNGGTETFIMNMFRNINRDLVQFDFIVHTNKIGVYEQEIESLGGKIYRIPVKDDLNFFRYVKELKKILKEGKYKIVHVAMPSIAFLSLRTAKKMGVKTRISHSHSASYDNNFRGNIKNLSSKLIKYYSSLNFACSEKAGKYLFGNKKFEIIHNAVDVDKYVYNENDRRIIREEFGIDDNTILLGHIGRLSIEKNQKFLINVMQNLKNNPKYKMMFVGAGSDEKKLKQYVSDFQLEDKIIFTGNRKDANKFYKAFDCFLLPSLYEGLPTVAIEAQLSGLPCIISNNVTTEVKIANDVNFVELDEKKWEEYINNIDFNKDRKVDLLDFKDYDIKFESEKLQNIYLEESGK